MHQTQQPRRGIGKRGSGYNSPFSRHPVPLIDNLGVLISLPMAKASKETLDSLTQIVAMLERAYGELPVLDDVGDEEALQTLVAQYGLDYPEMTEEISQMHTTLDNLKENLQAIIDEESKK